MNRQAWPWVEANTQAPLFEVFKARQVKSCQVGSCLRGGTGKKTPGEPGHTRDTGRFNKYLG